MSTYVELIAEVRAQIDVTADQAYAWLLERARVMNTESGWLLKEATIPGVSDQTEYVLPADCVRTEAVVIGGVPYARSTLSAMDQAVATGSTRLLYADALDETPGDQLIAIWPPVTGAVSLVLRYVGAVPDDQTGSPPFPEDFHEALADGAIARGLARMDERFDSAGYFDARFTDATQRLRRRRNSHVGRGATRIRLTR